MSLPSWLKNTMGSPELAKQQSQLNCQGGVVQVAAAQQPFNVDPLRKSLYGSPTTGRIADYVPEAQAFGSPLDAIAVRITNRLIEKMPLTAAAKIYSLEVRFAGGAGEVWIVFDAHRRDAAPISPLPLPLTDDFPTDADISRILLAMP